MDPRRQPHALHNQVIVVPDQWSPVHRHIHRGPAGAAPRGQCGGYREEEGHVPPGKCCSDTPHHDSHRDMPLCVRVGIGIT